MRARRAIRAAHFRELMGPSEGGAFSVPCKFFRELENPGEATFLSISGTGTQKGRCSRSALRVFEFKFRD